MRKVRDIGTPHMYKHYKKQTASEWDKFEVTKGVFYNVLFDFHRELSEEVLTDNFEFSPPARLGTFRVAKRKMRVVKNDGSITTGLKIDWKATREMWEEFPETRTKGKTVKHLNKHTDGYFYYWLWDKSTANFTNKKVYKFIPCRFNKRRLAAIIKSNDRTIDFYE